MRRVARSVMLMILGVLLFGAPSVAGAYSPTPTGPFPGCGQTGGRDVNAFERYIPYYFDACNVIENATTGWTHDHHAHSHRGLNGGLSFRGITPFAALGVGATGQWLSGGETCDWVKVKPKRRWIFRWQCSYSNSPGLMEHAMPIHLHQWSGARCKSRNAEFTRGCSGTAQWALVTEGEQRGLERLIMARAEVPPSARVSTTFSSPYSGDAESTCDASELVYVACDPIGANAGRVHNKPHAMWRYQLGTRTVTIRIANFYPQRLDRAGYPAWGTLIKDPRSIAAEVTLPSGQTNHITSIAPFAASAAATVEYGALRPVAAASEATMVYEFVGVPVRANATAAAPTPLAGGQLTLRIALNAAGRNNVVRLEDGTVDDPGSSCSFIPPAGVSFDAIRCDAPTITVQGNNTLVLFNVRGV